MAQLVICLPCKPGDLSSDPEHPCEKPIISVLMRLGQGTPCDWLAPDLNVSMHIYAVTSPPHLHVYVNMHIHK